MPTDAEWQALLKAEDFTWAWVTNYNNSGKKGYLVISRKSGFAGNCIFLPAAGIRVGAALNFVDCGGLYWSSSLYAGFPTNAYLLYFRPSFALWAYELRFYGHSVRAVKEVTE